MRLAGQAAVVARICAGRRFWTRSRHRTSADGHRGQPDAAHVL